MKQSIQIWLMIVAATVFSMTVYSCKDDEIEMQDQAQQKQDEEAVEVLDPSVEFWEVVGQLTDEIMPEEGWQTATYAPSIGEPDGANEAVRVVSCADEESAAQQFADLTGLTEANGFTSYTTDYTYTNPVVGSMHYQKTGGMSLAVVDVDIKQMPGLSQIVFKSPEQMGENGSFKGTAYYRFGDIVSKMNTDGLTDYWICVRPSFGLAGKGDSHWVCLTKLPSANTRTATKRIKNRLTQFIRPANLCTNQTHMQNLAELIYAMVETDKWGNNLAANYKKLKYFNDIDYKKYYNYHNKCYFEELAEGWTDNRFLAMFGLTRKELRKEIATNGLNLIYSTATMTGDYVTIPMMQYTGDNLKTKLKTNRRLDCRNKEFNIYEETLKGYMSFQNIAGGTERAWVVRYATGKTLAKGSRENPVYDKYKKLPNCNDVFVFNRDVEHLDMTEATLKNTEPKQFRFDGYSGDECHYQVGDILKDEDGNRWFVLTISGKFEERFGESSPYAELVSFEGIEFSEDGTRALNLPSRDKAMRAAFWLTMHTYNTASKKYRTRENWEDAATDSYTPLYLNLYDYADYNITDAVQSITAQNGDPRQNGLACSVAYSDPNAKDQPLLRCVVNNQNERQDLEFYFWEHYPKSPSLTAQKVTEFSNTPIYLQDISDPEKVTTYGKDSYVVQPLTDWDGPEMRRDYTRREPRVENDPLAIKASNYLYDRQKWWTRSFNADMWKAPILMFRLTAVKDCGEKDYSTTTVDGHKLRMFKKVDYGLNEMGTDKYEDFRNQRLSAGYSNLDVIFLDGKKVGMPKWEKVWKN